MVATITVHQVHGGVPENPPHGFKTMRRIRCVWPGV